MGNTFKIFPTYFLVYFYFVVFLERGSGVGCV